jgi:hypothetical protein
MTARVRIEYEDVEPVAGWTSAFRVTPLLEWTHRILLTPATSPSTRDTLRTGTARFAA